MTAPEWSGKQWRATHAFPRRAGTGLQRFQHLICEARLTLLTFPLAPFLSLCERGRGNVGRGVNVAHPTRHVQRLTLPARQRERAADGGTEYWSPNAVVARAQYVPNKKSGFLITL